MNRDKEQVPCYGWLFIFAAFFILLGTTIWLAVYFYRDYTCQEVGLGLTCKRDPDHSNVVICCEDTFTLRACIESDYYGGCSWECVAPYRDLSLLSIFLGVLMGATGIGSVYVFVKICKLISQVCC